MHRMYPENGHCQTRNRKSNKNQNELVMAVIKYGERGREGEGVDLQPVIKLPGGRFIGVAYPL